MTVEWLLGVMCQLLADEVFVQLLRHVTENESRQSTYKGWQQPTSIAGACMSPLTSSALTCLEVAFLASLRM